MFKNYLKISFRNIRKYKINSAINIVGLTVGIALFLLITLYVRNELSYDKFNQKIDQIYRLEYEDWASLGTIYADMIAQDFPEVLKYVRMTSHGSPIIKYKEDRIKVDHFHFADASIFDIFTFNFLAGDPQKALVQPFSIVLTQSAAQKIFGTENPIGKTIRYNNQFEFTVTGIIEDVKNFHLTVNVLASINSLLSITGRPDYLKEWGNWSFLNYLLLSSNHDQKQLEHKINQYFKGTPNWKDSDPNFHLRPLRDIYFSSSEHDGLSIQGNLQFLYLLIAVSIFILLIACINFINLSTARASLRIKEVGVRKVVGSQKANLALQFLTEAVIISLIASLLALGLANLLLPVFNHLISKELTIQFNLFSYLIFFSSSIVVGILAGAYPAFYLSSFQVSSILKRERTSGQKGLFFRRALIVFQFAISIILITATMLIFNQLEFMKNKDLGFNKEQLLYFYLNRNVMNKFDVFKEKLLQHPQIIQVSRASAVPGQIGWTEHWKVDEKSKQFSFMTIDPNYFDIMDIEVLEGRNFSWDIKSDESSSFIVNETAVKYFGWDSPIGKPRRLGIYGQGEIIGIVKDFHFHSLHKPIGPLVFGWKTSRNNFANIKIATVNVSRTIHYINEKWNELCPEFPFEYNFLDESFDNLYKSEEKFGRIFGYFSFLAIFIACLGLLGLVSFTTSFRIKEIGIRKVLGASISGILLLLTKDFTKWVLLANLIAWPVAWYAMNKWLQNFAYRIDMSWWMFVLAGGLALVIALLTVSWQAIRAATANPVEALRYE